MRDLIVNISLVTRLILPVQTAAVALTSPVALSEINKINSPQEEILAKETLDLTKRSQSKEVNEIFRDNILLILHYLKGDEKSFVDHDRKTEWEKIREPFEIEFRLKPGETFAFHDKLLAEFEGKVTKTIPVKYEAREGFKVVDGLYGNGVCHLATLMNWVATEARLESVALVNHDFFPVPETPQKYGVAIYYTGEDEARRQNLYIINTLNIAVILKFFSNSDKVEFKIVKTED